MKTKAIEPLIRHYEDVIGIGRYVSREQWDEALQNWRQNRKLENVVLFIKSDEITCRVIGPRSALRPGETTSREDTIQALEHYQASLSCAGFRGHHPHGVLSKLKYDVLRQLLPGYSALRAAVAPRWLRLVAPNAKLSARTNAARSWRRVVLDEIHRLDDPSELLKIAADHHPGIRVLVTGSSSLGARTKFRDTLADRKREVWLTPMTYADTVAFGQPAFEHRMARGGLPPFFLARPSPEREYQEWLDAYWAKDVQELFRLEKRATPTAIECKWSEDAFDPAGMPAFRQSDPAGENILVAADVQRASRRRLHGLEVRVVGLAQLAGLVT